MFVRASVAPQLYAYVLATAYFCAIVACPQATVWPSALGSLYPSRPLCQIGVACALLPYAAYLVLWALKTKSVNVCVAATLKFWLWLLVTYITRTDEPAVHGVLEFVYSSAVCYWMAVVCWKSRKTGRTARSGVHELVLLAYAAAFVWSLHELSRFFQTGSGYPAFKRLRALGVLLDIAFDYMNKNEFDGVQFSCDWAHAHTA